VPAHIELTVHPMTEMVVILPAVPMPTIVGYAVNAPVLIVFTVARYDN
jgi:hypothetical protein